QDSAQCQQCTHWYCHDPVDLLRPRTTVPMMAASNKREAISKGNTKGPNSTRPISATVPCGWLPDAAWVAAGAIPLLVHASQITAGKPTPRAAAIGQCLPNLGLTSSSGRSSSMTTKR